MAEDTTLTSQTWLVAIDIGKAFHAVLVEGINRPLAMSDGPTTPRLIGNGCCPASWNTTIAPVLMVAWTSNPYESLPWWEQPHARSQPSRHVWNRRDPEARPPGDA